MDPLDEAIKNFGERAQTDENTQVLRFLRELRDLRARFNMKPGEKEHTCYICGKVALISATSGAFFCQEHRSP